MPAENVTSDDGSHARSNDSPSSRQRHSESSFDDALPCHCACGMEVVVRTSWTNNNLDRHFQGCPDVGGCYCGTFQWVDPSMCHRAIEVIPGLLRQMLKYESSLHMANIRTTHLDVSLRWYRRLLRLTLLG
ncbi:hypothetical protein Salat_1813900 [Sesamum alatum]|uniref:Zinc finger GRF-type domain-containing protein n=1 Tax=Sesamum alatum TaxID=300844 RepID=A0AAE2CHE0_9LAMI|nr:hypothetical protein Salat_1813900 [Sesamum alatum]